MPTDDQPQRKGSDSGQAIMDELKSWWEISQLAGAGAALVLGPACWLLWKRLVEDTAYIREMDKQTIKVLGELSSALTHAVSDAHDQHTAILRAISDSSAQIKGTFDGQATRNTRRQP